MLTSAWSFLVISVLVAASARCGLLPCPLPGSRPSLAPDRLHLPEDMSRMPKGYVVVAYSAVMLPLQEVPVPTLVLSLSGLQHPARGWEQRGVCWNDLEE